MTKKTTAILICVGLLLSATGCKTEKAVIDAKPNIKPKAITQETVSKLETVTVSEPIITEKTENPEKEKPTVLIKTETVTAEQKEEPYAEKTEITASESKPTTSKQEIQENSEKREQKFLDNDTSEEVEAIPIAPQVIVATADDSEKIAEKILEYINSYRTLTATKLSGLTKYAEYRSRQLISRFEHNTEDERAAATALQYGEYVDPLLYGMNGEPYYTSCSREAIAKAGYAGTVDDIAQRFANLIKNSAKHWCYVGADEYSYIGVGVTYESGMWYCDVAVAKENTDEK